MTLFWISLFCLHAAAVEAHEVPPGVFKLQPNVEERPLRSFGSRRYDNHLPLPTWGDLSSGDQRLGAICDSSSSAGNQCGQTLVCRKGVCRHCLKNDECPGGHQCVPMIAGENECRPYEDYAWEQAFYDPWGEGMCSFLIFFSAALAAAAGTGGGGVFVPLLIMLSGVRSGAAVPLSQSMVLCGSVVNLSVFMWQRHPDFPGRPKIDYNCVALFVPTLCLGVTLGVLVNRTIPKWLLVVLLLLTLGLALWRTGSKGIKQWKDETKKAEKKALEQQQSPGKQDEEEEAQLAARQRAETDTHEESHMKQVVAIAGIWLIMLLASFHGMSACTWRFGGFLATLAILLVMCTVVIERYVLQEEVGDDELEAGRAAASPSAGPKTPAWKHACESTISSRARFPAIAFGSGFLGGMMGLGGGIILGPVLLEVGMHSEAVQATTSLFVFLSSSLATTQFFVTGSLNMLWHYALWYSFLAMAATIVGQRACEIIIRKYKRFSAITLAIAGILLFSLVALTYVGFIQVREDIMMGRQMWFSTAGLCSGGTAIVTVDVDPATPWPNDVPQWR
eukprot:TRINITY_DN113649_c0_g1_i1.p1 TRINITY_DN113649_c0_g1~~TRINITY_DN113649_c0_g1_i1.p1  ORF type:complete len:562 (-),score=102.59 TRINITY_DN113649_c0_g1_i1:166-1851(-)